MEDGGSGAILHPPSSILGLEETGDLLVHPVEPRAHLQGGVGGALGVILVGRRGAEDRDQLDALVGDVELIDHTAELLDRLLHSADIRLHRLGGLRRRQRLRRHLDTGHLGEQHTGTTVSADAIRLKPNVDGRGESE